MRRLCILVLLAAAPVLAQDLEPRTYTNIPVGQNFLGVGYAYSEGELNPAPGIPLEDAELDMHVSVAAYVRSLDLWGKAGKLDLAWARSCFKGDAIFNDQFVQADRCGTTDPSVRLSYLFYGAPAMSLEEFRKNPPGRVMGASLKIRAPLGDYNNENLINSGANRWSFKPEVGISNQWGRWSADAAIAATFYTNNDKFSGDTRLEQDPLYQVQAHLIYHLHKGRWVSINGNYFWGGETEKNGVFSNDRQENSRLGITLAWPLNAQHSLKFYASRGVVTRIGNDSDTYGVVWQYRWGD